MNVRTSWNVDANSNSDIYYTKEETTASVIENFNIRRLYSAESEVVTIDGVSENVLIQDHSNPLNENKSDKKIHVPMGSALTTGSYVIYNSETWLTISRVNIVGNAYKSAQIIKCNYNLKFLSSLLQPISRQCFVTRTRSGTDVNGNPVQIELGDGILSLTLPYDSETSLLDRTYPDGKNQRLLIDFGSTTPICYQIVNADRVTKPGLVTLDLEECQLSEDDNVELMIAGYDRYEAIPSEVIPAAGKCEIVYSGDAVLSCGLASKKFSPKFYNSLGVVITVTPVWDISMTDTSLESKVLVTLVGEDIYLQVTDVSMIGETVRLNLADDPATVSKYIMIGVVSSGFR